MKSFLRRYYLLSIVVVIIAAAGILQLFSQDIAVRVLLTASAIGVALKLGVEMFATFRSGHYGVDILAIAAIISTLAVGEYWASIIIVLMLTGGESLEAFASRRAKRELTALLQRAPQQARLLLKDGSTKTIGLNDIAVGDTLSIRPGEVIPVDATLIDASAELDESSLTGESLPVEHTAGQPLLSGSINTARGITITALRSAKDSQYQKIIQLVTAASHSEAPFVRLADRFAIPFTLISFAIAAIAWIASGDPVRFAEVLVLATPCPLLLATPIALISGMSRAARNGILIKSGAVLETLARIRTVAFDKTGTLTKGEPSVDKIEPATGFTEKTLLQLAASAEQRSLHTLGAALVTAARKQHLTLIPADKVKESVGKGITAHINGSKVMVGKATYVKQRGTQISEHQQHQDRTSIWVSVDGAFAGRISFSDIVRPESRKTLSRLKAMGIKHTLMLTGDAAPTAQHIADSIGIADVRAELLPEDKVNAVREFPVRPVMMVGDGVNDAPVLAVADVGIAMGARGSTAASETADVVVLVDDISKTWQSIFIAKKSISIAIQGILIGIGLSIILMIIAATGAIPAVVGALLQEIVDVIVIFNALRVHIIKV